MKHGSAASRAFGRPTVTCALALRAEAAGGVAMQGIIRRMEEDGPDRGGANLDILSRSVRHRLRDLIDDVRPPVFLSDTTPPPASCWQSALAISLG